MWEEAVIDDFTAQSPELQGERKQNHENKNQSLIRIRFADILRRVIANEVIRLKT
jgi:hypothetical protein